MPAIFSVDPDDMDAFLDEANNNAQAEIDENSKEVQTDDVDFGPQVSSIN